MTEYTLSPLPVPLLAWYAEHARALPWRGLTDPYPIWVSEIMLQQTRVAAVTDYFARFLRALPTVADLAACPEDELMKLWQGLGYYSRARNLQQAARTIVADLGGVFPQTYDGLLALRGVGAYTAGAVASIAFGVPVPAVDGNVLRVAARITGDDTPIDAPALKKRVTAALAEILPKHAPVDFNQALMELGATVCLPVGAPLCGDCPAGGFCAAYQTGRTDALPVRARKKPRRVERRTVFFIVREGRVALRRRPERGLLAGLWEYPNTPEGGPDPLTSWGVTALTDAPGVSAKHIFTHIEWHMTARRVIAADDNLPEGWVWADRRELRARYAVPAAFSYFGDPLG